MNPVPDSTNLLMPHYRHQADMELLVNVTRAGAEALSTTVRELREGHEADMKRRLEEAQK